MKLKREQKLKLYTNLVRVRKLDEMMVKALLAGKLSSHWTSQKGQEAVGVGASSFLRKHDYVFYCHRGHGISPGVYIAEHFGKGTGGACGMKYYSHFDMELGIPGLSGTLGGDFVLAAGIGIAAKKRGKGQVVVCMQGDGTYGRGTFHEAALMAANWKLPVIWGVENNQYMIYTPTSEIYPKENIADLAFGYGMPGIVVDGQDVIAVCEAFQAAVDRARAGEGPSLIECKTYRIEPHVYAMGDLKGWKPRPQEEIDVWRKRDPINLFRERLLKEGILKKADVDRIDRDVAKEMEEAERFADESPPPDPEILKQALYSD
jgi:TPP-dependent pyruvate/acetoin dehydrogenase alpha subunit